MRLAKCSKSVSSYSSGCRCADCKRANADYNMELRRERAELRTEIDGKWVAPVAPDRHGFESTYVNWVCRCDPCTDAASRGVRERLGRAPLVKGRKKDPAKLVKFGGRVIALVSADKHGKYSTYRHYRCRCEPCRAAYREQREGWK